MNQESELMEALDDWGLDFKRKNHPVALTLFRAATVIRKKLAAAGGTEGRGASSPPSCPGGDSAESTLRREVYGIIEYWQGVSECNCSSEKPNGACLKCDLEKLEDRTSELLGLIGSNK